MSSFIDTLYTRNTPLFYFGLCCLLFAIILGLFSIRSTLEVQGVNALYKPMKFALSTFFFSWAMGWYTGYLNNESSIQIFNWVIIITLGFEIAYIALQALKGEMSHFNDTSAFHSFMFGLMAVAAVIATLATAYIGILFTTQNFPTLPDYYVMGIRIAILLFVIFSLQGGIIGSNDQHLVGGPDSSKGIAFLNWNLKHGDLRVAHFVGMHALQVLPVLSFYILKNTRLVLIAGILYGLLAAFVLVQALQGRPITKFL